MGGGDYLELSKLAIDKSATAIKKGGNTSLENHYICFKIQEKANRTHGLFYIMLSYSGIKWGFFSIPPDTRLAASVLANNVSKQAKKEIQR